MAESAAAMDSSTAGAQAHVMELAFAADQDKTSGFKLLDVVRESGGGDGQRGARLRTAQWAAILGNALKQCKAARIGESLEDCGALFARKANGPSQRRGFFLH